MSPSLLSIILNIGKIIAVLKDVEKTIADAAAGQNVVADLKGSLTDVVALIGAGLIKIPGITDEQLAAVVKEIEAL